jgi:hypothetical protein
VEVAYEPASPCCALYGWVCAAVTFVSDLALAQLRDVKERIDLFAHLSPVQQSEIQQGLRGMGEREMVSHDWEDRLSSPTQNFHPRVQGLDNLYK